jgi:hypothetical protein
VAIGVFQGVGLSCQDTHCQQGLPRACCAPDGSCTLTLIGDCLGQYHSWRDHAQTCEVAACSSPGGACCRVGAWCDFGSEAACTAFGSGSWRGPGTSCNIQNCARECPCDWTANGVLYIEDLFNFSSDFAAGFADFNNDGRTNDDDFSQFVDCFLHSCR